METVFQEYIFKPLQLDSMTFYPTDYVKERLVKACTINPSTGMPVALQGLIYGRPDKPEEVTALGGGGGLYGSSHDYLLFLQAILQSSPQSPIEPQYRLLSKESYTELFKPSLSEAGRRSLTNLLGNEGYSTPEVSDVSHSLGLCLGLSDAAQGMKKGYGHWSGAAKTMFWLDPAAGIVVSQTTSTIGTS